MTETDAAKGTTVAPDRNAVSLQSWITTSANIGVLFGLVLVILQMNQSTQLARTAYKSEGNVVSNQIWANLMSDRATDVIEKSIECPKEMTYSDFMALDAFLFTSMNMIFRDYQLMQEGLYSEADWKRTVDTYVHWYLANPFGKSWWDEEAKTFFPADFSTYVTKQLNEIAGKDSQTIWLAIRSRVTGTGPAGRPGVCKIRETPDEPLK